MTTILLAIALGLGSAAGVLAQEPPLAQYNQANERYRQGQYPQAREQYQQVVAAGVRDPQVYYNLGNACFKAGKLGEAVLWYERALRLAPRDADIRANLHYAQQLRLDKVSAVAGPARWLEDLYLFPTLDELSLFFGLVFLAACSLGGWRWWRRTWSAWWQSWLLVASICLAVATGTYLGTRLYGQIQDRVVVLAAEVTARSAPDLQQTAVFVVHEGTCLLLARSEGNWVLVRLPTGLGGWVPADTVEQI